MYRGYVRVYRKALDNPVVFKDADHVAVWIYLLLNATHKNFQALFGGRSIALLPGQLITGRRSIADKLKINENKVQRILNLLKNEQLIEQQACNKNRIITLVSWEVYQSTEQQNEQQVNNKRTTSEQQVNTNKNVNNDKHEKNVEVKEKSSPEKSGSVVFEIPEELNTPEFLEAWELWIQHRKEKRLKMTPTTAKFQLKKLSGIGVNRAVKAINNSIANGYQGIFEPTGGQKNQSQGDIFDDLKKYAEGKL